MAYSDTGRLDQSHWAPGANLPYNLQSRLHLALNPEHYGTRPHSYTPKVQYIRHANKVLKRHISHFWKTHLLSI